MCVWVCVYVRAPRWELMAKAHERCGRHADMMVCEVLKCIALLQHVRQTIGEADVMGQDSRLEPVKVASK